MYKDPLHIPSARLVVAYKGKEMFLLNKRLLDSQNCWENLEAIKEKHVEKLSVYEEMENTDDKDLLYLFDKLVTEIEFELQDLWGFSRNINYHKFWERPKCQCPILDNYDSYPFIHITTVCCPLHGE